MKQIIDYHAPLIEKHGVLKATGFSRKGQSDRFDIIYEAMKARTGDSFSILDYGCGVGDFAEYLTPAMRYTGIDLNPEFIQAAHNRFPDKRFYCGDIDTVDISEPFDYVIASGVMCYDLGPKTLDLYKKLILDLWTFTKNSLIFNVLRSSKDERNITFENWELVELIDNPLYSKWSIVADYRENDATIVLRR